MSSFGVSNISSVEGEVDFSNYIAKAYRNVEFRMLPIVISSAYRAETREGDIFLMKFLGPIRYYGEFAKTIKPNVMRNVPIDDQYDLYAYMQINSDVSFNLSEIDQLGVKAAMVKMRMHGILPGISKDSVIMREEANKLLDDYERELSNLYCDFKAIGNFITEQCKEPLVKIKEFQKRHEEMLYRGTPLIGMDLKFLPRRVPYREFYDVLSVADQYELARWEEVKGSVDLAHKPTAYILLVRLLLDESLPRALYGRHPHLVAIKGDLEKIVEMISKEYPENDDINRDLRLAVTAFAEVSGLDESLLVTKCLESIQFLERKTSRTAGSVSLPGFPW